MQRSPALCSKHQQNLIAYFYSTIIKTDFRSPIFDNEQWVPKKLAEQDLRSISSNDPKQHHNMTIKTAGMTISWTYGLFGFLGYRAKSFLPATSVVFQTSISKLEPLNGLTN